MIDDTITAMIGYNRRLSSMTIFLASMAFLIVVTAIAAFIYVTRKGNFLFNKTKTEKDYINFRTKSS
jgi:uncharacterized membrane protein